MPTTDKRPLKVFLCHAHADRDSVRGLYARLTKDGVDAWLDKEKLLPGQDWELEIRKAVREADVVVVCLSKQFNQAGFRQKEVRLALDTAMEKPEGEIFIIPARLEECDNLESLRKWHWVDLFEDDGYEMLMRTLRTRADRIGVTLQSEIKQAFRFPKPIIASAGISVILLFLCYTMYVIASPVINDSIKSATQAIVRAELTRLAGTQTEQSQLTEIPFASPTVQLSDCKAIVKIESPMYLVPSTGLVSSELVEKNEQVQVISRLDDRSWYPMKYNDFYGWMSSDVLDFDTACPVTNSLVHMFSLMGSTSLFDNVQSVVVEDTFANTNYTWLDESGSVVEKIVNANGDYQINIPAIPVRKEITTDVLDNIKNPIVSFSVTRQSVGADGYIGILFFENFLDYFEIRILNDCSIEVRENNIPTQVFETLTRKCSIQSAEYVEIETVDGQVAVSINGQSAGFIKLVQNFGFGKLSFVAEGVSAKIDFIVVATSQ